MIIDGLIATEAIDKSGESLSIEGCDISSVEEGVAYVNHEHKSGDSGTSLDNVGKVIFAKKIFKESDCENARQLKFYKEANLPCIYAIIRLTDEAGHEGAKALAASIRDELKNDGRIKISYSVEGNTLARKGQNLTSTLIRGVAITAKPCNRSVQTGILSDPLAPPGFNENPEKINAKESKHWMAELAESKKSETRSPDAQVLSTYQNTYTEFPDDLLKATEAGSYNTAPSSLTGGAALQIEDQGLRRRYMKNQAKAAYRDWDKSEPFRDFLKHRLPEADEDYLDRFSDMVDEFQIKKAEAIKAKKPLTQKEPFAKEKAEEGPLSIRGKPVPPTAAVENATFDEHSGVLRTPRGSFPMYIPSKDPNPANRTSFHNIMQDPAVNKIHDYAFDNWKKAHHLLKTGKLPEQVIMHAALFSMLSPNCPVPTQEMMFSHLVDTMKQTGIDATGPNFHMNREPWKRSSSPDTYPVHSREHFARFDQHLRIKNDSKFTNRKKGDIGGFMLADAHFEPMENYHKMHEQLKQLVAHHGSDGRSAASEMLQQKVEAKKWRNRRKNALASGRQDPGEYPGIHADGLAPKTVRYMLGMMGAGNVVVPDTHFVRYLFGLEKNKDTHSIEYIKSLLWNENAASPLLEGIDRHYIANHDAVKHMAAHPAAQGINAEDLAFPAFWRNWMAIVPHEKARGMKTGGFNEGTDHRPFWDAISQHLDAHNDTKKADQDSWSRALDTAKQHLRWQEMFGEHPAMIMYMASLLPELLGSEDTSSDANGDIQSPVIKMENLAIQMSILGEKLRKSQQEGAAQPEETVEWQGKKVSPGVIRQFDGPKLKVLGHDDTHFHVVPIDAKYHGPNDISKISKMGLGASYRVQKWPQTLDAGTVADWSVHGHSLNTSAKQKSLIHGLDFSKDASQIAGHQGGSLEAQGAAHWREHPDGGHVYMKTENTPTDFPSTRREVIFHNLARDVFGMGDNVAPTALVKNPKTNQEWAAIEQLDGEHYNNSSAHKKALKQQGDSGELDKAGLVDWVMGMDDRHSGNWMVGDKGDLKLIDHGIAFADKAHKEVFPPDYLERYWQNGRQDSPGDSGVPSLTGKVHPVAQDMARKLDVAGLSNAMSNMGVPKRFIDAATARANFLKASVNKADSDGREMTMSEIFNGFPAPGGSNE